MPSEHLTYGEFAPYSPKKEDEDEEEEDFFLVDTAPDVDEAEEEMDGDAFPKTIFAIKTAIGHEKMVANAIARRAKPHLAMLVPEGRMEVTTEGGLDVAGNKKGVGELVKKLRDRGIVVSLFIEPNGAQIDASAEVGADSIEIHTGQYANARKPDDVRKTLVEIEKAAKYAHGLGLVVNAGHGLTYRNVRPVVMIPEIVELNIGHTIIARALMVGMERAVREMKELIKREGEQF